MTSPLPVGDWPGRGARHGAGRTAVQDPDVRLSYGTLEERSDRLAHRFREAGYRRGDRIATVTANSADHVVTFFGCAKAGIVLAPLSWRAAASELAALLSDAEPALVLTDSERRDAVDRTCGRAGPPVTVLGPQGVEEEVPPAGSSGDRQGAVASMDDPVLLLYSSGSTGRAKGVPLSHRNCWSTNQSLAARIGLTEQDVVLVVLPQFHVAAWNVQPLLAWLTGARVLVERSFDPGRVLRRVAGERVTVMMGVPTAYQMIAAQPGFAAADLSSLRLALVGGAPTTPPVRDAWAARGVPLAPGYGLTEAGPNVLCQPEDGSDMVPYPGVQVTLRDPVTGRPVDGPGRGELLVGGGGVFGGYWRRPEETRRVLAGGWLATGDLAERTNEGRYRIVGRSSAMYISGGENVHPAEVEQALLRDPDVATAAVVGVPDDRWGEVGVAFVVPHPGARIDPERVRQNVRRHLAGFKVPRWVVVVQELPLTGSGKIDRPRLRGEATGAAREPGRSGE